MGRVEHTVEIEALAPRVFFYLWPERVGAWYAPENGTRMEVVSPGGIGPGARIRVSGESRWGPRSYEAEVTDWEPPHTFGWRVVKGASPAEISIRCEPVGARTQVTIHDRYRLRPAILGMLVDRLFTGKRVAAVDRAAIENLKALAEGRRGCA